MPPFRFGSTCYDEALALGGAELEAFDQAFPPTDSELSAVDEERRLLDIRFSAIDVRSVVEFPLVEDSESRALITLLASLPPAVYSRRPALFPWLAMRIVNLSLTRGNCEASCFGYSLYAMVIAGTDGDLDRALALSEASIALNHKLRDPKLLGTVLHVHANHIVFWKFPYAVARPLQDRAFVACMDVGDLTIASHVSFMGAWQVLERGQSLADTEQALDQFDDFARGSRHEGGRAAVRLQRQFARALRGETAKAASLSDATLDGDAARAFMAHAGFDTGVVMHDLLRVMLAWLHGRYADAEQWLGRGAASLPAAFCLPLETTWTVFDALTAAAQWDQADAGDRPALVGRVARAEVRLARWAAGCPANFAAKHALVVAELARLEGRSADALKGYEQAARSARDSHTPLLEVVASQLAERWASTAGLPRVARGWARECHEVLGQWGAVSLLAVLEAAHPELRVDSPIAPAHKLTTLSDQFDVLTAIKASQTLSREFVAKNLIQSFLRIVLEHAGAQRAVILLVREGRLEPADASTTDGQIGLINPLATGDAFPQSIVTYVERSLAPLVLADAGSDPVFSADPYVCATGTRSVLCMPILARSELVGVLYLENRLAADAFSTDRLTLLEVLLTQLAISLEGARQYKEHGDQAAELARQEALQWSERRYREMVESMSDAFFALDRNWCFVAVNKHQERLSNTMRAQILGRNFWEVSSFD